MRITAIVTISLIFVSGCNSPSKDSNSKSKSHRLEAADTTKIALSDCFKNTSENLKLSDICENISYVRLETTEESLIGNIVSVQAIEEGYLVNNSFKSLLLFDKNGKFIWKINRQGRGPLEYELLAPDFGVDHRLKEIVLPDRKNIFIYNFYGQFIKEIRLPFYTNQVFILSSGLYVISNSNPYNRILAYVVDRNGTIIKKILNTNTAKRTDDNGKLAYLNEAEIKYYDNGLLLSNKDTIWQMDDRLECKIRYIIDGRMKNSKEIFYKYTFNILNKSLIGFYFFNQIDNALFDIKNNLVYRINGGPNSGIIDDIDSGPDVALWKASYGILIDGLPPTTLLSRKSKLRKESNLYLLVQQIKEEDNPLLRIIKLKE